MPNRGNWAWMTYTTYLSPMEWLAHRYGSAGENGKESEEVHDDSGLDFWLKCEDGYCRLMQCLSEIDK